MGRELLAGVMGGGLGGRGLVWLVGGGGELQGPGGLGYLVGVVLGLLRGRPRDRACGVCW